jgi:hypothetical protein
MRPMKYGFVLIDMKAYSIGFKAATVATEAIVAIGAGGRLIPVCYYPFTDKNT